MNNLAKSTTSQDNKQKVEMWKHGLVIWNSTWATFMDLGEIPLVILPSVCQLRFSGKSGGIWHSDRKSEQGNMSHSLME